MWSKEKAWEWYKNQPERKRWFLALTENEYDPEMPEAKEASEIYSCTQEDTRNTRTNTSGTPRRRCWRPA